MKLIRDLITGRQFTAVEIGSNKKGSRTFISLEDGKKFFEGDGEIRVDNEDYGNLSIVIKRNITSINIVGEEDDHDGKARIIYNFTGDDDIEIEYDSNEEMLEDWDRIRAELLDDRKNIIFT